MGAKNDKISYYNLLQKKMKKSYDLIQTSEYNREFSFKMSKFISSKKRRVFDILIGETFDWKFYLLNRLKIENNYDNIWKWENDLHHYIENEFKIDMLLEKYFLENNMFINQFTLRDYPIEALKDSKDLHEPVLFLLYDSEEIGTLSEKSSKPW